MNQSTPEMPMVAHISGAGDNLVLVHGGRGSHTHWSRNIDVLAKQYRVFALDLPGFGDSENVPRDIDADGYVSRVTDGVRNLIGDETASIAGFSFGGAVSAQVARQLGRQCRKLALLGPGGFGEPKGRMLDLKPAPDAIDTDPRYRAVIRHNLLAMMLHSPDSLDERTIDDQVRNIARGRFNSLKISLRKSIVDDLRAITCPVTMIWGENDVMAYPSPQARADLCRAARPDIDIHILPGAGHWVQYEAADRVNDLLLRFLKDN